MNKGAFIPGDYTKLSPLPSRTATFSVKVIEDKLPVYSSASASSSVRGSIAVNTTWTVKGGSGGYYRITYNGNLGYIASSGVVPSRSNVFGVRTTEATTAHSGAGSTYPVMTTFPSGSVLNVVGRKNGYYQTQWRDQNNFVQYVWISSLTTTSTSYFWMQAALATEVRVRSGPGINHPIIQTLSFNAYNPEYIVTDNIRGWYKVGTGRWLPGWQTIRR